MRIFILIARRRVRGSGNEGPVAGNDNVPLMTRMLASYRELRISCVARCPRVSAGSFVVVIGCVPRDLR